MLLIALISIFCFGQNLSPLPKQLQGIIPDFDVLTIENEFGLNKDNLKENLKKTRAKRIALSFFATWCVNCKEEFKLLRENAGEIEKNGVQVYLINVGESIHKMGDKVSNMVKKYAGNSFQFYFDPAGNLLKKSGLVEKDGSFPLPLTFILDSNLHVLSVLQAIDENDYPQILWNGL